MNNVIDNTLRIEASDLQDLLKLKFALYHSKLKKVVIDASVEKLPAYLFLGINTIEEVVFEGSTKLNVCLFDGCKNLKTIVFPKELDEIPAGCFYNCTSLKELIVPEGVLFIKANAFKGAGLTKIILPKSLEKIDDCAFAYCRQLDEVLFEANNVTRFGNSCFSCCKLTEFDIPSSVVYIGANCFELVQMKKLYIPNSIDFIAKRAFSGCIYLQEVYIPASVNYIDTEAFCGCRRLKEVVFEKKLFRLTIGCGAFSQCRNLRTIDIPEGTAIIDEYAFSCTGLREVRLPSTLQSICYKAFEQCYIKHITCYDDIDTVSPSAFQYCTEKRFEPKMENGRIVAYKGFLKDMTCRGFQYEEGKTYKIEDDPVICANGFHACMNPLDVFNYYAPDFDRNAFHKVYLRGKYDFTDVDTKVCAQEITIGEELSFKQMIEEFNNL